MAVTVFAFLRSREPCHHHFSPRPRRHGIHQIQRFRSVEGLEALVEAGNKFQLGPAVMAGASAPILILHGASDARVPLSVAQQAYGDITYSDKTPSCVPAG